jgi:hypothetical protein
MKLLVGLLAGAAALASIDSASAAIIAVTDFSADAAGVSVVSAPPNTLATATSLSAASWTAATVLIPLGGLATGDPVVLSNPIGVAVGDTIDLSWDSGTFHDTLTTTGFSFSGDTLDIASRGELVGPGVPLHNASALELAFTQAGGTGFAVSGSGTYIASTVIPEPSTWAMFALGLGAMTLLGWRRKGGGRFAAT